MTEQEFMELIRSKPGNDEKYDVSHVTKHDSVLNGKRIIYLGSSVTYGAASLGRSFVEYIEAQTGAQSVKEAVSGTTLTADEPNNYIERMLKLPQDIHADLFICQLSTNDATKNKPLGTIAEGCQCYDITTITGAIEYIIQYAKDTWKCPVCFYTGTKYDSDLYEQMTERLHEIARIRNIGIIDLWNDPELNAVSPELYDLYMADPIHPTMAGYKEWWTPVFIRYLEKMFSGQKKETKPGRVLEAGTFYNLKSTVDGMGSQKGYAFVEEADNESVTYRFCSDPTPQALEKEEAFRVRRDQFEKMLED